MNYTLLTYFLLNLLTINTLLAQFTLNGEGTSLNPYEIANYDDLKMVSDNPSEWGDDIYFKVVANIEADDSEFETNGFQPIGSESNPFKGYFDGGSADGYAISNLHIDRGNSDHVGLFGYISVYSTEITNIDLTDFDIIGKDHVGAIVGYIKNSSQVSSISISNGSVEGQSNVGGVVGQNIKSTLSNIFVNSVSVQHSAVDGISNLGGVIGYNQNSSGNRVLTNFNISDLTLSSSYSNVGGIIGLAESQTNLSNVDIDDVTITAKSYAGGVVGYNSSSKISNSIVSNLDIEITDKYVGGLVGKNDGSEIKLSMVHGKISGKRRIGGITGDSNTSSKIKNVNAIITDLVVLDEGDYVGGIVGGNYNSEVDRAYAVVVSFSVELGGSLVSSPTIGGIVGEIGNSSTITKTYFDDDTFDAGVDLSDKDEAEVTPLTTADFNDQDNFSGFDFTNNWEIGTLTKYNSADRPYMRSVSRISDDLPVELLYFNAKANSDNVVLQWATATEINNDYFQIERSSDKINWTVIEQLEGGGNSNTTLQYEYIDRLNGFTADHIYYRLKQVDFDGTTHYYSTFLKYQTSLDKSLEVFPTVTDGYIKIISQKNYPIQLFNMQGQDFSDKIIVTDQDIFRTVSLNTVTSGWYLIKCGDEAKRVYKR
ncbi:autotransporter outer membrane beta-barrel domain-containing protein [Flammeovirga agarivorans]|uniref:Por secretion system C-terminal sorting domain-containing protein n=1 Tax=Flammeovirga agarivorans TaxID=2726742 RepID=A0A7X8SPR3_9BACT|nr:hypothetical protein [Flammeovirga agarivorans]NLR94073.1 hypothetical protein [Flammeovirga agarivorans]